jgi:Na+-transporting methylmalonyl-CoA/oxaloacetate decarboxylase gamma subunit
MKTCREELTECGIAMVFAIFLLYSVVMAGIFGRIAYKQFKNRHNQPTHWTLQKEVKR